MLTSVVFGCKMCSACVHELMTLHGSLIDLVGLDIQVNIILCDSWTSHLTSVVSVCVCVYDFVDNS